MIVRLLVLVLPGLLAWTARGQSLAVVRVVDSATYELSDGRRVRLIGIAPPERFFPAARSRGLSPGRQAALYAEGLVAGRRVRAEHDPGLPPARAGRQPDPAPAYLYVVDAGGALLFNVGERLLYDGYALVDTQQPFDTLNRYLALQQHAAEGGRGLWGGEPAARPAEPYAVPDLDARRAPPARDASGIDLLGECSAHPDCEWVTASGAALGFWRSKPYRQCPCAPQR